MNHEKMNNQPPNVPVRRNPLNEIQNRVEHPMMLHSWTQTSNKDFGVNEDFSLNAKVEEAKQRELLQKIRELDEIVREKDKMIIAQAEILHRPNQILENINSGHQQVSAIILSPQSFRRVRSHFQGFVPNTPEAMQAFNEQSSSTQENRQNITHRSRRTIIPDQNSFAIIEGAYGQEPIEIEISEETNVTNLNCSADCERLEICLSEPKQIEKNEINTNCEPGDQLKQIDQPSGSQETPATTSRIFEVYNQPQYNPTQSLSPELQPSTSGHCHAISSTPEVYNQPQYIPTRSLSPEELQPSTSKHCSPISRASTTHSLSSEELQPSTSKHFRAKNLTKTGKIKKERKRPKSMIAKLEPIRQEYTIMGPNRTVIEVGVLDQITWDKTSTSAATRKLLSALFSRETLATHSLTGRPSPAFKDKPIKRRLDQKKIEDIIYTVSQNCGVTEKEVRGVITTKCADENKMWRLNESKKKEKEEKNKKNEDN